MHKAKKSTETPPFLRRWRELTREEQIQIKAAHKAGYRILSCTPPDTLALTECKNPIWYSESCYVVSERLRT